MRQLVETVRGIFRVFEEYFGASSADPEEPNPLAWLGQKGRGHERHQAGWRAEEYAARHLTGRGYHILGRNVYVGVGEIDIVAEHDRRLVFIEVRSRSHDSPVRAASTVTRAKSRQILRCARVYMGRRGLNEEEVDPRYDIAEVTLDVDGQPCDFAVVQAAVSDDRRPRR
jgi:putative endonuclease